VVEIREGRSRVVIEGVKPQIDCGAYPIKRVVGDTVVVEADAFVDGHDVISCVVFYRKEGAAAWAEAPMEPLVNDRWRGAFSVAEIGRYHYTIMGWVNRFKSWARDLGKRVDAGQEVSIQMRIGADLIAEAASRAGGDDAARLHAYAEIVGLGGIDGTRLALSPELAALMYRHEERLHATVCSRELSIVVDRLRARFSAWYEMFPRSTAAEPGHHGTFADVEARLPYVASMGFDVLYLPPIHPIGRQFRKGRNNTVQAQPSDPGSPWAIGAATGSLAEGGHKAIHPELGTLEDFRHLVQAAKDHGLEIALDIAFQASGDHPYLTEHAEWFRKRPDGTIQYAENPPKKYQDIYPFDFESSAWRELWEELKSVFLYWSEQGVHIFRVDNPHTKPFAFWEWVIPEIKRDYPETIFLAEAFTRPKLLYRLAKLGFTQSYNYFAWRNTRWELTEYLTELTQTDVREYCGPNLWPNTPDILAESLQYGGRPAFVTRFILAATLGPSYGIYGPAYELMDNTPLAPGKEEYLNSEKFEIKQWNINRADSLAPLIGRVNQVRRDNPALQANTNLRFHSAENDQIIAFTKSTEDGTNQVLVVVNLDPHHKQSGFVNLPLEDLNIDPDQRYQVHDLLTGARYLWNGPRNYVELDPQGLPAHIFAIRRRARSENDFDYFA
jgi:starch synthase (maltosyl-transferring)